MVQSCCAYNCTERSKKGGLSFYGFPSNKELRKKWVEATQRKDFIPTKSTKLCEKHFEEDCFQPKRWANIKKLKETAIPSIFDFPEYYKKELEARKPPKVQSNPNLETAQVFIGPIAMANVGTVNNVNLTGAQTAKFDAPVFFVKKVAENNNCGSNNLNLEGAHILMSPFTVEKVGENNNNSNQKATSEPVCPNCETLERTQTALGKAQAKLKNNAKKIKVLQQKCRRQESKISNYKSLVRHLHSKNLIDDEISELLEDYIPDGGEIVLKIKVPKSK